MASGRDTAGAQLLMLALACAMALSPAGASIVRGPGSQAAVTSPAPGEENFDAASTMSEMMSSDEEAKVDKMFPDRTRDDLKLELILKALEILKTYEGSPIGASSTWLPPYDVMEDDLKLRLILKALLLLKDREVDSTFAGHFVGELKLSLTLKAIFILENTKTTISLSAEVGELKLFLLLKAISILEVYHGKFVDTVFFTDSKEQLKLILILKAITLLKHGKWPVDEHDLWPKMGEEEEEPEGQSETTVAAAMETTATMETTEEPKVRMATEKGDGATKKPWLKTGIVKVFKWLKGLPKILHKKKHHIFH